MKLTLDDVSGEVRHSIHIQRGKVNKSLYVVVRLDTEDWVYMVENRDSGDTLHFDPSRKQEAIDFYNNI